MKIRRLLVMTSVVVVAMIITTGLVFALGTGATIGGGEGNSAEGDFATVGGGENNAADGAHSTVGGGAENTASGHTHSEKPRRSMIADQSAPQALPLTHT